MNSEEAIEIVRAQVIRFRRELTIFGASLVFIGALFALALPSAEDWSLAFVIGFFVLLGAGMIWGAQVLFSPLRSPLLRAVTQRASEIAWIYHTEYRTNGIKSPSCNAVVGLLDGKSLTVNVPNKKVNEFFAALHTLAPHAVMGYSEDRAALFKKDPRAFLGTGGSRGG